MDVFSIRLYRILDLDQSERFRRLADRATDLDLIFCPLSPIWVLFDDLSIDCLTTSRAALVMKNRF